MTPLLEYSEMVQRVEAALAGSGVTYTPRLRQQEDRCDQVHRDMLAGQASREDVTRAIRAVEQAWLAELARARRAAAGGKR